MPEKAELDILEIELGEEEGPRHEEAPQPPGDGGEGEGKKGRIVKMTLISLALIFVATGLGLWLYLTSERREGGLEDRRWREQNMALPANFVLQDRFAVNLKDEKGGLRVLVCDVVFEMNRDGEAVKDRSHDFRRTIYKVVKNKGSEILKTPKFRKQLAKEIEKEMNGVLGEGAVKQVYFTKFTVL